MKNYSLNNKEEIKELAYHLKKNLETKGHKIKHSDILNVLSQSIGYKNWNTCSAVLEKRSNIYNFHTPYETISVLLQKSEAAIITERICQKLTTIPDEYRGQAFSLTSALARALVWLRENERLILDNKLINKSLCLEELERLSMLVNLPSNIRSCLNAYLICIPQYDGNNKKQNEFVKKYHNCLAEKIKTTLY